MDFCVRGKTLCAIRDISLDIYEGESLAIVGESGSGKSVLTKAISGMLDSNGYISKGSITFKDKDLVGLGAREWEHIRGKRIATVFQDPLTSLDPIMTIGKQISSVIIKHQNCSEAEARKRALAIMKTVGIDNAEQRYSDYPFQYSGGMRQRIVIAIALSCQPEVLICDEPTTALDVTVQAQILKLIKDLKREIGFSLIFITHDLGVVANVADRVAVLYAGQIVEIGTAYEIFYDPRHPYTWALLASLPQLAKRGEDLFSIPGAPPSLYKKTEGEAFAPRNPYRLKIDTLREAPLFKVSDEHFVKSWLLDPRAKSVPKPSEISSTRERLLSSFNLGKAPSAPDGDGKRRARGEAILSFRGVDVTFGRGDEAVRAVKNATFDIYRGEIFSLVGESGSGKSTLGKAVIGLNPLSRGEILFSGESISRKSSRAKRRELKRDIQMIFQDPASSLNERATVDYIISEGLYNFRLFKSEEQRARKVRKIIEKVGLLPEHLSRYPHEFSGGQRQRIGIARAMVMEPKLVIADEPISALDVSVRAQVLNLLKKFRDEKDITYLFIAHDLSVVRFISDRIGVIYKGTIVEIADAEELFLYPMHPYTRSLISAIPIPDPELEKNKILFTYDPSMHDYSENKPTLTDIGGGHLVYGNERETEEYKRIRAGSTPKSSVIIKGINGDDLPHADSENEDRKKENAEHNTDRLLLDTGSRWYTLLAVLIPLFGIICGLIFKRRGYIRSYRACKRGAIWALIASGATVGLFVFALLLAVLI